jgi:hypothetical protein
MKILIGILLTLSIVAVSIFTMINGWGLKPENWGWISFGYLWTMVIPFMMGLLK